MAKPMRVRLATICTATGYAMEPELLDAIPRQTNPNSTPESVAIMILFLLCMMSLLSYYITVVLQAHGYQRCVSLQDVLLDHWDTARNRGHLQAGIRFRVAIPHILRSRHPHIGQV